MWRRLFANPLPVVLGALLIAVGGYAGVQRLPVDLFPSLDYPLVNVISHYPPGTARDVEQLVTRPIEQAMLGLPDLMRVHSVSAPGFSQVSVEFAAGVGALQARQLVYARLAQVQGELPADTQPALENVGTSLDTVATYALKGGDPLQHYPWVRYHLVPRLEALPGVARVTVMGGGEPAYRIDLDPARLRRHHLSAAQVATAVRAANALSGGGYIEQYGRDLLIRTDGRIRDLATLRQVPVGTGGAPVLLRDVAHVYAGAVPKRYAVTADGEPAVVFNVRKQPGASTLAVSRAVGRALAAAKRPAGTRLAKFYDQADIISLAYRNMRDNLLAGALFAVLALFWVLGRNRSAVVVAATLPLCVLGTFALMAVSGLGLNLMTLGAITVAIGLIDDDAIVVLENIDRHRRLGHGPLEAAVAGVREVFAPDLAGTLTVLAAFVPLVLVTGLAGHLVRPFGLVFGFMLGLSLLLSVTVIPLVAARWGGAHAAVATAGARGVARLGEWNRHLLHRLLRHPGATLVVATVVFLAAMAALAFNPVRLLPLLDERSLLLSYQLAPGTALGESDRVARQLEGTAMKLPGVTGVFRRTGSPRDSIYIEGPDQGELIVRLARGVDADRLRGELSHTLAAMPGVLGRVNEPTSERLDESFSGLPALFGITVYGTDLAQLYHAAAQVAAAARRVPGVGDVMNNTTVPVDQLEVAIDRDACTRYGVSVKAVADAVHTAMAGEAVARVVRHQRPVTLFMRYAPAARASPAALGAVLVPGPHGPLPLSRLAQIRQVRGYPTIEHRHGLRALTMTADLAGNPFAVMARLRGAFAAMKLPSGIEVGFSGEYRTLLTTVEQMGWVVAAAVLLVYGIIAIQLGSLLDPLVVLAKLPLDFAGAALALVATRQTLDVTVLIGFVTLVGVAMNNGIMLLSFVRGFRRQGMAAREALEAAVALRTRPLLLSNLTTLLALIPAAIGLGEGPQLLRPLAVMLFGGLTAGTLLTLNVLPAIYLLTERWRRAPAYDLPTAQ